MAKGTLYEISWEVCNKVGGIYTVITSKLPFITEHFSSYYAIGPWLNQSSQVFKEEKIPQSMQKGKEELEAMGIKIHYGTWNVKNKPKAILVEHLGYSSHNDELKARLWEEWKVDSLGSQWHDFDEVFIWSVSCGLVIEKLRKEKEHAYVHAHEWMSGGAIFHMKTQRVSNTSTVFTTHATMLGRALSGHGENLIEVQDKIDPRKKAYELGVQTKYLFEQALAKNADCFTTVSELTGEEAKLFYGKEADVYLYNGFDNRGLEDPEELVVQYSEANKKLENLVQGYFHDFHDLNSDKSQYLYISGRNEVRNKGCDLVIESLSQLNEELKPKEDSKTVVAFILLMVGEFDKNQEIFNSLENFKKKTKREEEKQAPLSTHYIPEENEIISLLRKNNLNNLPEDKVKVIVNPCLLKGDDGFFNIEYYDLVKGMDLALFPSFYEPWGYTPLESISYAVPTVTSDLAGFGRTIKETCGESCPSVQVLKRIGVSDEEAIKNLTSYLKFFTEENQKALLFQKEMAKYLAMKYDWSVFIKHYLEAYNIAREKSSL
jgi:phosphorylase/glycogen(starch) synthase